MHGALGPWPLRLLVVSFWIAAGGIVYRSLTPQQPVGTLTIAVALALVCVDQGRMAWVDLRNIHQLSLADDRVVGFTIVTAITIVWELIGFYLAWQYLVLGMVVMLASQLFFNTVAQIQLYPQSLEPIRPFPFQARWPVLLANAVALGLIALWQADHWRQLTSGLWLAMVVIYLIAKYCLVTSTDAVASGGESP